eukprot:3313355-Pyramimonas_sp.AAC.1
MGSKKSEGAQLRAPDSSSTAKLANLRSMMGPTPAGGIAANLTSPMESGSCTRCGRVPCRKRRPIGNILE